jgi:uncharacterized membrane protein YbhN (UPF0104 family)
LLAYGNAGDFGLDALISGWRLKAVVWSVAAAATGYFVFSLWGGWREVLSAFGSVGVSGILIALALALVNYSFRFMRWQLYLKALGHSAPAVPSALIYVAGFALTTTPGKAGEMLRGVFLKARGMPYIHSTAAFLSERLSDLIAIVLLTLIGITMYPKGGMIVATGVIAVGFVLLLLSRADLLALMSSRLMNRTGRVARTGHHLLALLIEARRCHTPSLLILATALSLLAWSAEAFAFYLILHWMGLEISIPFAFFVYAISMLAGAISFLPGGLGGAEAVMVGLLLWAGMPEAQAVAATVIIRLTTLWFAVALGGLTLLLGGKVLQQDTAAANA